MTLSNLPTDNRFENTDSVELVDEALYSKGNSIGSRIAEETLIYRASLLINDSVRTLTSALVILKLV